MRMSNALKRGLKVAVLASVAVVLALAAAGCGGSDNKSSSGDTTKLPTSIGPGEGKLSLVAWEGYTQPEWVKPFEKQTGCMVTSQYDMVSASGDASLRLIEGKNVQPMNPDLIPDYPNFIEALKSPPHNTVDGMHYGISLQWGPNTLLYNTDKVTPAPTSWESLYDPKYKGEITI